MIIHVVHRVSVKRHRGSRDTHGYRYGNAVKLRPIEQFRRMFRLRDPFGFIKKRAPRARRAALSRIFVFHRILTHVAGASFHRCCLLSTSSCRRCRRIDESCRTSPSLNSAYSPRRAARIVEYLASMFSHVTSTAPRPTKSRRSSSTLRHTPPTDGFSRLYRPFLLVTCRL